MDPLQVLPAEIILGILNYVSIPDLAKLTTVSQSWHAFIDVTHQDAIFSSKTTRPETCRDFFFLNDYQCISKHFESVNSWKDACTKQYQLETSWKGQHAKDSLIQAGFLPVWRFRADFKRRFILSTSQGGGLTLTDMDRGRTLWGISSYEVRPFAHLEYDTESGTAILDRYNELEVWQACKERSKFCFIARLDTDIPTRGFHLASHTLCVVSDTGKAVIHDLDKQSSQKFDIAEGAVGHLYQNEDAVMISMGKNGFHIHSKESGKLLGIIEPRKASDFYHIKHENAPRSSASTPLGLAPTDVKFKELKMEHGKHPSYRSSIPLEEDEWGAGVLSDSYMVGISKGGRVFVSDDWQNLLKSKTYHSSALIECETDISTFEFGGWLSVRNRRAMIEVHDSVYVFPIKDMRNATVLSVSTSSSPQLKQPVSFMALWDDCFMYTYMTQHPRRIRLAEVDNDDPIDVIRMVATKAIRIISLVGDPNSKRRGSV